ncbi:hypothetical protein FOA52_014725 [Chlamydomonas sp. UWO 241]|nr:hypothetical protein FOA52_014725 [Chlamydomonas sp. UWO 241]
MPVPVSVTQPSGAGLQAHVNLAAETSGPWAKFAGGAAAPATAPATAPVASDAVPAPRSSPEAMSVDADEPSLVVDHLEFTYPGLDGRPIPGIPPLIRDMVFSLKPGSRCLLLGANGAGKTTFLKILGGKHMVRDTAVRILGRSPFSDTQLTTSGDLAYVGGNWTRDIAFAGTSVPLTGDFPAIKMINSVHGVDEARKQRLIKVLDIDPAWRMHQVSDGQRRRVQICVGLLKPFKVLLLDEITVDLDVLGRAQLMDFLRDECKTRRATVVYATHIFDGLEEWPSHVAYLARGEMAMFKAAHELPELKEGKLLQLVYSILSEEDKRVQAERGPRVLSWDPSREGEVSAFSYAFNNGWVPGTLGSSLSTNAVMRS